MRDQGQRGLIFCHLSRNCSIWVQFELGFVPRSNRHKMERKYQYWSLLIMVRGGGRGYGGWGRWLRREMGEFGGRFGLWCVGDLKSGCGVCLLGVICSQKRVKILVNVEMTGVMDNDGWCWSDEWVVIGGRGRGRVESVWWGGLVGGWEFLPLMTFWFLKRVDDFWCKPTSPTTTPLQTHPCPEFYPFPHYPDLPIPQPSRFIP